MKSTDGPKLHLRWPTSLKLIALGLASTVLAVGTSSKPKPSVFVELTKTEPLFDALAFPARVVPKIHASMVSEIDGIVHKVIAPLGTGVKKGNPVIVLKNTDPIYLFSPMVLRSPVNGVVSEVAVSEGGRVTRGQLLATITDPAQVKIAIEIPASDLRALTQGLRGELTVATHNEKIPAVLSGISPFVDPATGTSSAELTLLPTKSPTLLPPGLVGQVVFRTHDHLGIQIPEHALVYKGEATYVRTVNDGKIKLVSVTIGRMRKGYLEIEKGLTEGVPVVVRVSQYVAEGEEVSTQSPGTQSE